MKIALFVTLHHKDYQFDWLKVFLDSSDYLIIIHVDLKSRLGMKPDRDGIYKRAREFARGKRNVHFLSPRFTNWGGWTLSQALLDAIRLALRLDAQWTYFVNLSGQCYPLKPRKYIEEFLLSGPRKEYVETRHFSSLPADDWHLKSIPMLELPFKAIKLPGRRQPPVSFEIAWKGSQWVMLTRDFSEWIVSSDLTRQVRMYLKGCLLSDELLIQTLLMNGPFRPRAAPSFMREIVWPGPKTFTIGDWEMLATTPALFARKFDARVDVEVLKRLARHSNLEAPSGTLTAV